MYYAKSIQANSNNKILTPAELGYTQHVHSLLMTHQSFAQQAYSLMNQPLTLDLSHGGMA